MADQYSAKTFRSPIRTTEETRRPVISSRSFIVASAALVGAVCLASGATSVSASTTSSAKTTAKTTAPGKPTSVSAVAASASSLILTWSAPLSDGGSAITGYTGIADLHKVNTTCTVAASITTCTIGGLVPGKRYAYGVKATNAVGTGASSKWAMITLPAA